MRNAAERFFWTYPDHPPGLGMVVEVALSRRGFGVLPMSNQVIAEQQKIADTFKDLGLIPTAINVSDAVRKPGS